MSKKRNVRPLLAQPDLAGEHLAVVRPYIAEPNPGLPFLFVPHTGIGAAAAIGVIVWGSFYAGSDEQSGPLRGLLICGSVFLIYCTTQLRDSLLVRPHPAVGRAVHGAGLLYLLGLAYLLSQPPAGARAALSVLDPDLDGSRPAENDRAYADDCRLWTPGDTGGPFARVAEVCADVFVVAHTVGWLGKALLLRDWRLGWALSVLWELLELTFQDVLPNFHEW